jgi:hypothetical protein
MVQLSLILATVPAFVLALAIFPSQAAVKDICQMDKAMLGF